MQEIPIDKELEDFKGHLDANERTIFSAKFGDGKTYFLDKFKEKYKDEFYFITVYPINFSVAENADIFEYIKRDIIIQLANDDILSNIDFTALADTVFSWESMKEVIAFLLSFVPGGEVYNKILKKGEQFFIKYEEKKSTSEKYIQYFENQKGGLYEHDAYTKLIESAIKYIQNNRKQKVVLIFEDLDRIDPAHLFRILNVLGANIDCQFNNKDICKPNKFGADRIITVFDYEVTAHIFHHFYGDKANYEGYISKFTAHNIFKYSVTETAKNYFYSYIQNNCHISKTDLDKMFGISDIKQKHIIKNFSIRDIEQILGNIEAQIKQETINLQNISFSSIAPLTLFTVICKRIGYSNEDIKKIFINALSDKTKFLCLNWFILINRKTVTNDIVLGNTYFQFSIENSHIQIDKDILLDRNNKEFYLKKDITSELPSYIDKAFELVKS